MEKTAYPIKEFFSKGGHLASPWDNLSIREKAEMMKVAVRNGITSLSDIKQKYNEFAEGGEIESPVENSNIYAGGSYLDIAKQHIKKNEDWLPKPYRDAPKGKNWRSVGYGFNDSGFRNKYPQGISKYYENGITEAQAEKELNWFLGGAVNHLKKVYGRKWDSFNDNQKAAIIDTYYQRPASVVGKGSQFYRAVMAGDKNAGNYLGVAGYGNRNKDRRKLFGASQIESVAPTQEVLPISEPIQSMPEETVDFIPWNPQAFFGVNNNTPIIIQQEAPVVEEKMPTPEEIERQERQQGLANFQTIMGMLNNTSNSTPTTMTPFESTVSMLTQQSPIHYFSDGGSIYIKPSHRGRFTELKERTGHSASWFKENGTLAQKKMATFALNARKWKHGLGGNLFDGGGKEDEPDYMFDSTMYTHPEDTAGLLAEQVVTPNGNYPVLNPKGGEAWTIEALKDLGVPLYTKTSIPKQKDVELQHLEDKAKADEFVNKTIGNGEAFTPWGLSGLLFNEGMGAVVSALPESVQEVLAKGRYISPSYWVDRGTGLSDEQLLSGEGKLFGTGTGTWFDILATKGIGKGTNATATEAANTFSKIRQLSRLEKNYTGVPHKELKEAPGTYMDEAFPSNHTQHTIWSTDDIDYPRSFDGPDRTIYDVYADPKELSILETPSIPDDKALYWQGLPYKLENGKVSFADNLSLERVGIPRSKDISLKKGGIGGDYTPDDVVSYIMKDGENGIIQDWKNAPGTISTDDVVKYSLDNGYDATRFNRVFDGASEINGTLYDYPINELVLNPNTPRYVLPHGASKLRLWNQLPTRYSQSNSFASQLPYTTLFRNYTNNR